MPTGPNNCITDVPGIKVGSAHDRVVRTGVTVIVPGKAAVCAADVRGGGPGTRETDALRLEGLVDLADAVVLSGGSVYGLAAADAVCAALGAQGRGFALTGLPGVPPSPIVPAAILYDLANGGEKSWGDTPPYAGLGRAALRAISAEACCLGSAGAGFGASAGRYPGGLGTASWTEGGVTVGAIVAVNSFGSPYVPNTDQFWAAPFEQEGEFGGRGVAVSACHAGLPLDTKLAGPARTNTTIGLIAIDASLTKAQAQRIAIMAQDGLARAIRPAHGPTDGDVVFAMATAPNQGTQRAAVTTVDILTLGTIAGDVLARAIARGVYEAERQPA